MKKVFLSLAFVAALTVVSCKQAEASAEEAIDSTAVVVEDAVETVDSTAAAVTDSVEAAVETVEEAAK